MKLFIGCASSKDIPEKYFKDCEKLLETLFKDNNDLIFGAYNKGIMGLAYNIAKENKRHITGICTEVYKNDLKELDLNKEGLTDTISERTMKLIDDSDAIIILPGGIGTMQELFTAIECKRSKEFDKPIIIFNSSNYFDELLIALEKIYDEKFTKKEVADCYYVSKNIEDILDYLNNYKK